MTKTSTVTKQNSDDYTKNPIVHIFIGTKAQYIKTAPVIRAFQEYGIPFRLIDTGQHSQIAAKMRPELEIPEPNLSLYKQRDITSIFQAATWFLSNTTKALIQPNRIRRRIFAGQGGVCLVHGDTPSTLLAAFIARRAGIPVAHLEAGLRSFNFLRPFPEELIRIIVMRMSSILFAPSQKAANNIKNMKINADVILTQANTNIEASQHAMKNAEFPIDIKDQYCLVTMHRVETLYNTERLRFIVDQIERLAKNRKVVVILHAPTRKRLEANDLLKRFQNNENILLSELLPHGEFLRLIYSADFVITDGGSIQEECAYIGVPCLVMRSETERNEGLGENIRLGCFSRKTLDEFVSEHSQIAKQNEENTHSPSLIVSNYLKKKLF